MLFYFVKKGDTLTSISEEYHIPVAKLIADNDINNKNELSVGQCLIINNKSFVYEVKKGDTLTKISNEFHIDIAKLKNSNPNLTDKLQIGQKIKINYENDNKERIKVNGYCYSGTKDEIIKKTLPYLSYLSIFAYKADENGDLDNIDDDDIISYALDYNVAPIMVVTNIKKSGGFSSKIASSIINDESKTNRLFNNILNVLQNKKYYGVNFDFEYIYQDDKESFKSFIKKAYDFFKSRDYFISIALAPKTTSSQKGLLYEAHDYNFAGKNSDKIILMTYEWGYTYGDSQPVAPLNKVESVVKYAVSQISPDKILLGIPNYGYDFDVPRIKNKPAKSLSLKSANELAFEKKSEIKYGKESQTPYFNYAESNAKHEVQFDNAYSFYKKLELVDKYALSGISIWTITTFNTPYYLLLDYLFVIDKNE